MGEVPINGRTNQNGRKIVNFTFKTTLMELIDKHRIEVENACSTFKVTELYAFGSVLTNTLSPESDIDFIVSIMANDPIEYAENYFDLKFELERIFKRKRPLPFSWHNS